MVHSSISRTVCGAKFKTGLRILCPGQAKEVLVKAMAQAVPVYCVSSFKLPRGLCEHLKILIRKFWWGSKDGHCKPHWVSWKAMTQPKGMGGFRLQRF